MKKPLLLIFFSVLILSLVLAWFSFLVSPVGGDERIFVINSSESLISIAARLEKESIIRNKWAFLLFLKTKGEENSIQAGRFDLSSGDSVAQTIKKLRKGRSDLWVTFLEGWRREEIALKLEQELGLPAEEFLSLLGAKEGYLFPDTYSFPADISATKALFLITDNFERKWQLLSNAASEKKLSREQVLIFASLVEREARNDQDRSVVAGVLIKRWQAGWPLQVDASVQYAKASIAPLLTNDYDWWPVISKQDLEINSPFNTYKEVSLPPSSICNPSFSSLSSVVNYPQTNFWFYLSDPSGKMYFAETLEQHNNNIKKYL
ncbi:MAG: endolytic transglycosylase MltG [Patescibacteria group bacterium]|nr:endolytic transglycosylase MltG [Patescibacteria group bacterium]